MKEFGSHFSHSSRRTTFHSWNNNRAAAGKTTNSAADTLSFVTDKTNTNAKCWAVFWHFLPILFAMVEAVFTVQSFREEQPPIPNMEKRFRWVV